MKGRISLIDRLVRNACMESLLFSRDYKPGRRIAALSIEERTLLATATAEDWQGRWWHERSAQWRDDRWDKRYPILGGD